MVARVVLSTIEMTVEPLMLLPSGALEAAIKAAPLAISVALNALTSSCLKFLTVA